MATPASDLDLHLVTHRRQGSEPDTDLPGRTLRIDVQAQDRIDVVNSALFNQPLRSETDLLGRLKQVPQVNPSARFQPPSI